MNHTMSSFCTSKKQQWKKPERVSAAISRTSRRASLIKIERTFWSAGRWAMNTNILEKIATCKYLHNDTLAFHHDEEEQDNCNI